jgi:hypothetical protein
VRFHLIGEKHFLHAFHLDQRWCVWFEHVLSLNSVFLF